MTMKLIIGLGNSGKDYENTRHNAGFLVADELKVKIRNSKPETLNKSKISIFKSQNFMNESGDLIKRLVDHYKINLNDLYVIHDDLDIPLGSHKIQFGRGPKDHNGLKSVDEALGTDQYWHIRVGVDNRPLDNKPLGIEYVLQNFTEEERKTLDKVIKEVCKKLAMGK